jgi:phosphatidylglycerophosphate synthase
VTPPAGTNAPAQSVNLPNAISAARIVVSPLIALLPLLPSPMWRVVAFLLYLASAISDYYDGMLARTRGLVTDLGKTLDPLADKLLLVATFVPLLILQGPPTDPVALFLVRLLRIPAANAFGFPFATWLGTVALPWWILALVLGRELFMTVFRQAAQNRGVVIAAIGPAKWKAAIQYIWVGAAYFWFAMQSLAYAQGWHGVLWDAVLNFTGVVGITSMVVAVTLTLYSLMLYLQRDGPLFTQRRAG